jgi:hypothetical protein
VLHGVWCAVGAVGLSVLSTDAPSVVYSANPPSLTVCRELILKQREMRQCQFLRYLFMEKSDLGRSKEITLSVFFQCGDVRDLTIRECNIHVYH